MLEPTEYGTVDLIVSSPPYEGGTLPPNSIKEGTREERMARLGIKLGGGQLKYGTAAYSASEGNLGKEEGNAFWDSARQIVQECYLLLRDGGEPIEDGADIDFCNC